MEWEMSMNVEAGYVAPTEAIDAIAAVLISTIASIKRLDGRKSARGHKLIADVSRRHITGNFQKAEMDASRAHYACCGKR
jgi:hypothetical protein